MKYKLVAIDMDGTLLNSNNQVSERTQRAINLAKEKGVHIILSTGRILESALYYSNNLNLKNPIVASNGAIVVDENSNIIYKKPMDLDSVIKIANLAKERNIYYHFYDEKSFYAPTRVEEVLQFYSEGDGKLNIEFKEFENIEEIISIQGINVYKFLFIDNNKDKLQSLRMDLEKLDNISTSSSWTNNIEAMGKNVSKGEALSELCNRLNIDSSEVIAIGDSENDLSMLKFAGMGVAMGNGDMDIKEQADHITGTNDEDGVAKIIEDFVL